MSYCRMNRTGNLLLLNDDTLAQLQDLFHVRDAQRPVGNRRPGSCTSLFFSAGRSQPVIQASVKCRRPGSHIFLMPSSASRLFTPLSGRTRGGQPQRRNQRMLRRIACQIFRYQIRYRLLVIDQCNLHPVSVLLTVYDAGKRPCAMHLAPAADIFYGNCITN